MKPLILGEAPGRDGDSSNPLGGRVARRLCEFAGFPPRGGPDPWREALASRFDLANLLDEYPGPGGRKGAAFPPREARRAAEALDLGDRPAVLLGRRLAASLGLRGPYFRWSPAGAAMVVVLPHPSGVNRVLNDPLARAESGRCLRSAVRRSRGGG